MMTSLPADVESGTRMAPRRSRWLAGMEASPIRDIPSRKARRQRLTYSTIRVLESSSNIQDRSSGNSVANSDLVTNTPSEPLTSGQTSVDMPDPSMKHEDSPEEAQVEESGQHTGCEGFVTIERYLGECDRYRSTSLSDPWPYPLAIHHAPDLQKKVWPLSNEIRAILDLNGFPASVEFLPYLITKPQYPGGNIPINLLRVILRAGDHVSTQLDTARENVTQLLHSREITDLEVEIVNVDLCFGPSVFPLSSIHPIVVAFESAKADIIRTLDRELGLNWNLVCPFRIGRTEGEAHPALIVHAEPRTSANWQAITSEISGSLLKYAPNCSTEVQFLPGYLLELQSRGISLVDQINPDGLPVMGQSIGIVGQENAGTLGGYFTLTQDGTVQRGFLTNYHVVRPSDLPSEMKANLDQFGCSSSRPLERAIQMESIAKIDRDATIVDLDRRLEGICSQREGLSMQIKTREQVGARPLPALQRTVEHCEAAISDLRIKRENLEQMPRLMGQVTATSGMSILKKRVMDWAFVQLTDTATEDVFRPNLMFSVPPRLIPWHYGPDPGIPVPEGTPLTEFGILKKDRYYLKRGRSTGVTAGICNGALACCNWAGKNRIRYDDDGHQVDLSSTVTEEFVIVNKKASDTEHEQASFAEKGDSGSLVININGQVCGLLYGATIGLYGPPHQSAFYINAGLVSDFSELSSSVRLKTTAKDAQGKVVMSPAELALPDDS